MDDLFIIAAGGTGAKVCEALIHLCAAGQAPDNVHVLLIDGDADNGNLHRTMATWKNYQNLQPWPWLVKAAEDPKLQVQLFKSKIEVYSLAESFDMQGQHGLLPQIHGDAELTAAMEVLLDQEELTDTLNIGFSGRPNLGCIVMSHYLRFYLEKSQRAREFIEALRQSARPEGSHPRVLTIGSIFGGTGASMIPIARGCINSLLESTPGSIDGVVARVDKLKWGKIMLLPYFQPKAKAGQDKVNSNRHLTDTSSALWFYAETTGEAGVEPSYLIGSKSPGLRVPARCVGGDKQVNPPFYHEIVAALAVLDFCNRPDAEDKGARPIRHFAGPASVEESCSLQGLPLPSGYEGRLTENLAVLFHLAAFWVNWRNSETLAYRHGLAQFAESATLSGWDERIHDFLIKNRKDLTDDQGKGSQALEYFARVLLWGVATLDENGSSGLDFVSQEVTPDDPFGPAYYSSLHNTLCLVKHAEIQVAGPERFDAANDNVAAVLCRLAVAGLKREHAKKCGHGFALRPMSLVEDNARIVLGIPINSIGFMLEGHGWSRNEARLLCEQYGLPEQAPKI